MAFEIRDNTGTLFKNDRKEKDSHPDYQGNALIGGVDYWISAWIKDGKNGKFMSLAFKPKEERARQIGEDARSSYDEPAPRGGQMPLDDDIPFAAEWRL